MCVNSNQNYIFIFLVILGHLDQQKSSSPIVSDEMLDKVVQAEEDTRYLRSLVEEQRENRLIGKM